MTIRPRFNIGAQNLRSLASREFMNREMPRELFKRAIQELINSTNPENKYKVLVYYGVGGIGKSRLRKQLEAELAIHAPNTLCTNINFIDSSLRTPARALLELKRNARGKGKINFIHFELAYSIYFKKKNPDYEFNKKKLPYEEEASVLGDILAAVDGLGIVGAATGIVRKAYEVFSHFGLDDDVKKDLENLEPLSAFEIEEQLPAYFAFDIKKHLGKMGHSPIVLFFDTYEELWANTRNESNRYTQDSWVRELITHLPNVLFVICGREKIRWDEQNPEWSKYLTQSLLNNLDVSDAKEFLSVCGIQDTEIVNKIITASKGHPYHLHLSVDTYLELLAQEIKITPQHFGSTKREILECFLRNLAPSEIETLKLLSIPRFYNYNLFKYLLRMEKTGFPVTQFDEFNRFSFISCDNRFYYLHSLMHDALNHFQGKSRKQTIHRLVANYYDKRLEHSVNKVSQDTIIRLLDEAQYHRARHLSKNQFVNWLSIDRFSILKSLQLMGTAPFLETLLSNIAERIGMDSIGLALFSIYVDAIHMKGKYLKASDLTEKYLSQYSDQEIIETDELLHLYIRNIHCKMFYTPVNQLIEGLLKLEPLINIDKYPQRYNEILFELGGNLGTLSGDFHFCRKWLAKSIRFALKHNHMDYLCRSLRKYTDILRFYGHLKMANKVCDIALNIARQYGYRYEIYLLCSKAEIVREEGAYASVLEYLKSAEKMAIQQGIRAWIAHSHLALAGYYIEVNNYDSAKEYLYKAEIIYKDINQVWGLLQVEIGKGACDIVMQHEGWEMSMASALLKAKEMGYRKEITLITTMLKQQTALKNKLMFL